MKKPLHGKESRGVPATTVDAAADDSKRSMSFSRDRSLPSCPLASAQSEKGGKPGLTQLTGLAILSSGDRRRTVDGIYRWISNKYPEYFDFKDERWKNMVRNRLSLTEYFTKITKDGGQNAVPGKGNYWTITPEWESRGTRKYARNRASMTRKQRAKGNQPAEPPGLPSRPAKRTSSAFAAKRAVARNGRPPDIDGDLPDSSSTDRCREQSPASTGGNAFWPAQEQRLMRQNLQARSLAFKPPRAPFHSGRAEDAIAHLQRPPVSQTSSSSNRFPVSLRHLQVNRRQTRSFRVPYVEFSAIAWEPPSLSPDAQLRRHRQMILGMLDPDGDVRGISNQQAPPMVLDAFADKDAVRVDSELSESDGFRDDTFVGNDLFPVLSH